MNVAFHIARRYFLSKKKKSFINFISMISMGSLCVATAALIIVLSGFNGMEEFLRGLFKSFDPDIRITPSYGKTFYLDKIPLDKITKINGISFVTPVLEEKVLIRYKDKKTIAKIKGVGDNFFKQNNLEDYIVSGKPILRRDSINRAVIGIGIQNKLGIAISDVFTPLQVLYPKRTKNINTLPENSFNQSIIMPSGIFALEKNYDEQYVFVPLSFAQNILSNEGKISSLEIKIDPNTGSDEVQDQLKILLGASYKVLNRDEQNVLQLRVLRSEKLFVFFVLTIIILIASLNIFLCLTMLVIEKKHDLTIMKSFGASSYTIFKIFIYEGMILSVIGGVCGMFLGLLICYIQIKFQILSLGTETAILDAYPVKVVGLDVCLAIFTILIITFFASIVPSLKAARVQIKDYL